MCLTSRLTTAVMVFVCSAHFAFGGDLTSLSKLTPGRVRAANALWVENPLTQRFDSSRKVVVADIEGPAIIMMIHFAMPQQSVSKKRVYTLGRDLLLRMYWDGELEPSVDCPLVDFFCDPAGLREQVDTALVNKCRGFNAYFPIPFRKSARIVLEYDGLEEPGEKLWKMMPCYSYVMYRKVDEIPADEGYFHAHWRHAALRIGKEDYIALEATGPGKFVGWNVTVRRPGSAKYPVDMNEKFYIDGESEASVEFQGIEDSFGFSWGFPPTENIFPLTGYWPFMQGAAAYRFFVNDAISFEKSLRVAIGFGVNEHAVFRNLFRRPGMSLQLSSTCYWYQKEPHTAFPPMPAAVERAPAPEQLFWPDKEPPIPTEEAFRARGVQFYMLCGRPEKEVLYAEPGFDATTRQGQAQARWPLPIYHCRADKREVQIELTVPHKAVGTLRIFVIDPDSYQVGRRQEVFIGDRSLSECTEFREGLWLDTKVSEDMTIEGKLLIRVANLAEHSNAVISIIEWLANE